ncbi:MAG: (d)CMP kinase [Erysipelotrichaceae bacterium]|uniref:(d)CMP kinase n=1 Tax=Floccifex sp. TaxID=2815810 RepID=UPI002A74A1D9|nr:(d)CMP kinase [Floccifex sp.]MDD7281895.1 (d)CMP kinase [Erysipelotrichaceae bacterium]MDY2958594.1 (d)CMP kinase [Floccifex sp.]
MCKINIAIDGPSGVGKSTIADFLAKKYGMVHLDTGAMYRCVSYYIYVNNVNYDDPIELEQALNQITIRFDGKKVFLNGEDVSDAIRTNDISMMAAKVSSYSAVRKKLVALQQDICAEKGYIVDGRDICSVVLPEAEVKIFMSASSDARAMRRYEEYIDKGIECDYEQLLNDINERDYQDSHRAISPLKKAEDAIEVDTSNMSIEQVVERLSEIIENR